MTEMRRRLGLETLPEKGVPRMLCIQFGLWAFGFGAFVAGSPVFFTKIVGLSASEVASGIALSNLVGLAASAPLGVLADRIGYRRSWTMAAIIEGAVMFTYPAIRGLIVYLVAVVIIGLARSLGTAGDQAYGLEALPEEIRVRTFAFMRVARNVGLSLGALVGGIALAIGTREAVLATPLIFGVTMIVNAIGIRRLPVESRDAYHMSESTNRMVTLRDIRFMVLALVNGILTSYSVLIAAIVPLWLVTGTRAPHPTTTVVLVVNTGLVILLQVRATKNAETAEGPGRLLRMSGIAFFLACGSLTLSHDTGAVLAVALVVAATVFLTTAELCQSAASWTLLSRLAVPGQRGAYSGVWGAGVRLQSVVGPAAFVWLVAGRNGLGWLAIGLALLLLGIACPVFVRWAERGRVAGPA